MTTGESFLYVLMLVFWVFGIAVAKGTFAWLLAACFPPAAWVFAAMWIIERLT